MSSDAYNLPEPAAPPRSGFDWGKLAVMIFFCGLVVFPLVKYGGKNEFAKWQFAAGMEAFSNGDVDASLSAMEKATDLAGGKDLRLQLLRADYLAKSGNAELGLKLCRSVIETLKKSDENVLLAAESLRVKSMCLVELGRAAEALKVQKQMVPLLGADFKNSDYQRNNLAYFRSLAGKELDRAKDDILDVIDLNARHAQWPCCQPLKLSAKAVIAANLLARQLGKMDFAEPLLGSEIELYESLVYQTELNLFDEIHSNLRNAAVAEEEDVEFSLETRGRLRQQRDHETLANLLLIHALNSQAKTNANLMDQAALTQIRELGFNPEEMVQNLPDNRTCFGTLEVASTYLDTYGCVLLAQGNPRQATRYLDLAILSAETYLAGFQSELYNHSEERFGDRKLFLYNFRKQLGDIIGHRLQARRKMGDTVGVAEDQARMREIANLLGVEIK